MINLTIDNSECKAEGLNRQQWDILRNAMSYSLPWKTSFFSGGYSSSKKYLITKHGVFPTGLLYIFEEIAEKCGWECRRYVIRRAPEPLGDFPTAYMRVIPYKDQIAAVEAARKLKRGIICAPTGSGKSVIIALLIAEFKVKTLVVVPNLELKKQLQSSLEDIFGKTEYITVENIDSVETNAKEHYDCVIIDEFHHAGAKTYRQLNKSLWGKTYYKFGLTATPFRSKDTEKLLLESVLSQTIYKLSYERAVEQQYIVPLSAFSIQLPKILGKDSLNAKWHSVYSRHIIDREDRNNKIVELVMKNKESSTLILVKQLRHGMILQDMLKIKGLHVPFANGQNELSNSYIKNFSLGHTNCLIASSIVGEGVDTRAAEFVVLAGGVGNSKISIMQNCGRVLRNYRKKPIGNSKTTGKVIIFNDNGHKWLREHNRFFLKTIKEEYDLDIVLLEIN